MNPVRWMCDTIDTFWVEAISKRTEFNAQGIANILWAVAEIANILWAAAKLEVNDPRGVERVCMQVVNKVDTFKVQENINTIWALATMNVNSANTVMILRREAMTKSGEL